MKVELTEKHLKTIQFLNLSTHKFKYWATLFEQIKFRTGELKDVKGFFLSISYKEENMLFVEITVLEDNIVLENNFDIFLKTGKIEHFHKILEFIYDRYYCDYEALREQKIEEFNNLLKKTIMRTEFPTNEIIFDKAVKYVQETYCEAHLNTPYMLLGDVAELIKITTGKEVDLEVLTKYSS